MVVLQRQRRGCSYPSIPRQIARHLCLLMAVVPGGTKRTEATIQKEPHRCPYWPAGVGERESNSDRQFPLRRIPFVSPGTTSYARQSIRLGMDIIGGNCGLLTSQICMRGCFPLSTFKITTRSLKIVKSGCCRVRSISHFLFLRDRPLPTAPVAVNPFLTSAANYLKQCGTRKSSSKVLSLSLGPTYISPRGLPK